MMTKIRTTTTLRALGVKTPRKQQNSATGVASQRSWGGPLARRHKAERSHSFRLDRKRAHAASKGEGAAPGSTLLTRTTHTMTTMMTSRASGVKRWGGAQTTRSIGPATGTWRQGPQRCPPGVGAVPPPGPLTMTSQAAACSPSQATTSLQARREATSPMTKRRREPWPSGCAKWPHWPGVGRPPARDAQLTACLSGPSQATTMRLQPLQDDRMATQDATRALRLQEQPPKHG